MVEGSAARRRAWSRLREKVLGASSGKIEEGNGDAVTKTRSVSALSEESFYSCDGGDASPVPFRSALQAPHRSLGAFSAAAFRHKVEQQLSSQRLVDKYREMRGIRCADAISRGRSYERAKMEFKEVTNAEREQLWAERADEVGRMRRIEKFARASRLARYKTRTRGDAVSLR